MPDIYRNRFTSERVEAMKLSRFVRFVSILSGISTGNKGDYVVRDLKNGNTYTVRGPLFEYEFFKESYRRV